MTLPFVRDLFRELERHPGFQSVVSAILGNRPEILQISGLSLTAQAVYTALLFQATGRAVLLLVDSNKQAEAVAETTDTIYRLLFSDRRTGPLLLPAHDILPYDSLSPHPDISEKRAIALWRLAGREAAAAQRAPIVIAPIGAALVKMESPEFYRGLACQLTRGEELSLDLVVEELERIGYQRHEPVEMVGQYAVRGGILDVYSPESARPVRVEFFGDQVESLRQFDIDSQRSVMAVEEALLLPLVEHPVSTELTGVAAGETGADEAPAGMLSP